MNMTLGRILRNARQAKGISQLALSLLLDVSQRHVSYIESDRARASRELIFAWMKAVDAPVALRNAALHHCGFSCERGNFSPPQDASLNLHQVAFLKSAAISFPVMIFNADWQLLEVNPAGEWLILELMPELHSMLERRLAGLNMIDALVANDGPLAHLENGRQVLAMVLSQIEQEAWTNEHLVAAVEKLGEAMVSRYGVKSTDDNIEGIGGSSSEIMVNTRHGRLAFFAVQSTLGHTQGITLQSLRIAHLFPVDQHTEAVLREILSAQSSKSESTAARGTDLPEPLK